MQRYTRILIGLAILICGCNRPASPPPAPAQSMAKPTAVPVQQVSTVEPAKKAEVDSPSEQATPPEPEKTSENDEKAAASDEKSPPPASHERIALLTPGGPLIVDVLLTVDGRPHSDPDHLRPLLA